MTVQAIPRRAGPAKSDGTTTVYPFSFKVFKETDVAVFKDSPTVVGAGEDIQLIYGTDYTVSLNTDQDISPGGTVTLTTPLAAGLHLSITSAVPAEQLINLTNHDGLLPRTLNTGYDKDVILVQQLEEKMARALLVPITSEKTPQDTMQDLLSAQEDARKYADQAKQSATEAKASEEKAAEYAETATILAPIKGAITTVAQDIEAVKTVALNDENIKIVAANINYVRIDAQNIDAIIAAVNIKQAIVDVAGNKANIDTVAGSIGNVNIVGDNIQHVTNVSGSLDDVTNVSGSIEDIKKIAEDLGQESVCELAILSYGSITNPVEQNCSPTGGYIKLVADNIGAINTNAENIDDIVFLAQHWNDLRFIRDDITAPDSTWSSRKLFDLIGTPTDLVSLFEAHLHDDAEQGLPSFDTVVMEGEKAGEINDDVITWNQAWSSQKIANLVGQPTDLVSIFENALTS